MKKIIIRIFIVSVSFVFLQCNDMLDINPISSISPQTYWQSKEDADNWMAGIYNQMQNVLTYNVFDWGESRSDNVNRSGTGIAQTNMTLNQLGSTSNATTIDWRGLYTCISLCNFGLKYFPQMIDNDIDGASGEYESYIGECYSMRALMYFYALRVWGRVPIITKAIESPNEEMFFPRSSINDVRSQIISDIHEALKTISNNNADKYRLNTASTYALLTDVHAYFQEYDEVIKASDNFLTVTTCTWISNYSDWKNIFTSPVSSTETIFTMYWNYLESGNMGVARYIGCNNYDSYYVVEPDLFRDLLARQDTINRWYDARRWHCFDTVRYKTPTSYNSGATRKFGKFVPWDPNFVNTGSENGAFVYPGHDNANYLIPIYRYADVMSLRAEALALNHRYDEALDILQKMRARVGYTPVIENDSTNFMEYYDKYPDRKAELMQQVILDERQLEFLGEGKRWFDLCRIGKTICSSPYYDVNGPPYRIPEDYYSYLRSKVNKNVLARPDFTDFEGSNINRVLFPIISGAFTANYLLRGDQNYPYDE